MIHALRRRSFVPLGALLLALTAAVALADDDAPAPPTPWPRGAPPTPAEVGAALAGALELDALEQKEEWLAAAEFGEASEHVAIQQADIDAGLYSKAQLFRFGDELFGHPFTVNPDGFGDGTYTTLRRVHAGVRGGLDTFSCAGCHSVGGPDGAGSETQNAFLGGDGDRMSSANVRNAPAILGLGLVQALGAEMTQELQYQRDQAVAKALATGAPVTVALGAHAISFGALGVDAGGTVDTSGVEGVDADLVVRPFGWKGTGSRLRRFAEDAARIHFGIQSHVLALQYQSSPDVPHLGAGPEWFDPDGDGHVRELEDGSLTALAAYMAMLEAPIILPPHDEGLRARWASGAARFDALGCASCHAHLPLLYTTRHELADTTGGDVTIQLFVDGDQPKGSNVVALFSDLKRHRMGPELADAHDDEHGVARDVFLTRPLWGLAESAPYLHDGRAGTIPEAILAHGGEAAPARDAFAALPAEAQADLHVFLLSLTREPKLRVAR